MFGPEDFDVNKFVDHMDGDDHPGDPEKDEAEGPAEMQAEGGEPKELNFD